MRLHLSWGIQDTSASSCPSPWSTPPALRLWGQWRPLHPVCLRSVKQTGTDFHIYEHTVGPRSPPSPLLISTAHILLRFHIPPRYNQVESWEGPAKSMHFNLLFLCLRLFYFPREIWTGSVGRDMYLANPLSRSNVVLPPSKKIFTATNILLMLTFLWYKLKGGHGSTLHNATPLFYFYKTTKIWFSTKNIFTFRLRSIFKWVPPSASNLMSMY